MKTGIRTEYDMHGRTVAEAEAFFHQILNESRLARKTQEVVFITGTGKIQTRLRELAKSHEIHAYIPLANLGCLIMEFE